MCYNSAYRIERRPQGETYLSTEKTPPQAGARIPKANEHQRRAQRIEGTSYEGATPLNGLGAQTSSRRSGFYGGDVLSKSQRLRLPSEFKQVYTHGRSYVHPLAVLYVFRTSGPGVRVGFSVGKKLGRAVARNRIKRRLREACRVRLPRLQEGFDLVFVGRSALRTAGWEDIEQAVDELLVRARLWKPPASE